MPYRRLPNTDQARLRALKTALEKGSTLSPVDLAFSQKTFLRIKHFVPKYEQAIQQYLFSRDKQTLAGQKSGDYFKKARLYVSHFLQVLNMSITRGELKAGVRQYYQLPEDSKSVPEINTEQQLLDWGKYAINGEEKRIAEGGTRLFNPSIAKVKVYVEKFVESYNTHKDLLETSGKMLSKVAAMRNEADRIIQGVWNETEATFENLPAEKRRKECSNYGIIYVQRKNEKD